MPTTRTIDPICLELRAARDALGLSQRKLAELIGTHRETICCWENGAASPNLAWLRKWAAGLGLTLTAAGNLAQHTDLIAQAIGDPGSFLPRQVTGDPDDRDYETITRWSTRAVIAALTGVRTPDTAVAA